MKHVLSLVLLCALLVASEAAPITTSTIVGVEIVTVVVPAGWSSAIVLAADRDRFAERPNRVLINGGYFDANGQPDALLINGPTRSGRLRHDSPYSGFVWADPTGAVHIARTGEAPAKAVWAIQTGPLLVEQGRSGINTTTSVAQRPPSGTAALTRAILQPGESENPGIWGAVLTGHQAERPKTENADVQMARRNPPKNALGSPSRLITKNPWFDPGVSLG